MGNKLTAEELAKRLHLNVQTVYAWVRKGKLPCQRIGLRPVLFDEDEIEEFMKSKGRKAGAKKMTR